jgi:site-specific DNA-cytosine methylase
MSSVANASGKTGSTADACLTYVRRRKPQIVMLECVPELDMKPKGNKDADSDLQTIVKNLEMCGYAVYHQVLNAIDYGVPQSRPRIYVAATLNVKLPPDALDAPTDPRSCIRNVVESLQADALPVTRFLSADDEGDWSIFPMRCSEQDQPDEGEKKGKKKKLESETKWDVDHLQAYKDNDLEWPPVYDEVFAEATSYLSPRTQQLVWYHFQNWQRNSKEYINSSATHICCRCLLFVR